MDKYREILKKYWGFNSFRGVQEEIVKSLISGKDTLGLMPTGGGKSITFQVPALEMEGVCLVITPLIALMNDQVDRLQKLDIKAKAIHSGMSYQEIMIALDNAVYGAYKFIYVSPERVASDIFREKIKQMKISFLAVDEAHCISQWGYDFRPSYLSIAKLRELIPDLTILALTATATSDVIDDIQKQLHFRERNVIQSSFIRENLIYFVRETDSKIADLLKVLHSLKGCGIVYLRNRKKTKEIAEHLNKEGINASFYHAGLTYESRKDRQEKWSKGETRIMVATNAFGMGIDKSNVRVVVHMDLPDSPEAYFQEAGRAGRDGKKSFAVLLVNNYDKSIAGQRLATAFPSIEEIKRVYNAMANFLQVPVGGGKGISYDFNLYDFAAGYKFNAVVAFNSLKVLEKHGYIELTDELNNPSRVHFLMSRDDLYKFQIENKSFDGFIKLLLRSYTGLFSDYSAIDEEVLARRANIERELAYNYLIALAKMKVISYIPARKTPMLIFTEERLDEKSLFISYDYLDERKSRYEKRIQAMIDYAFNKDICRNNLLLKYFGQLDAVPCGQCDVCKSKHEIELSSEEEKKLEENIIWLLREEPHSLNDIASQLKVKEKVLTQVIRIMLDNGNLMYTNDGRLTDPQKT